MGGTLEHDSQADRSAAPFAGAALAAGVALAASAAPAAGAASETSAAVLDLPGLAARMLAFGRLDVYRRLFADAASIQDPHRRYWARRELLARGLAAVGRAPVGRVPQILATVADGALTALEEQPAEPVLLNYAGVAMYELWGLQAAEALFEAALRLDPQIADVKGNLSELRKRRQARNGRGRSLHRSLPALAGRASEIADGAQPAQGLTLSLCMIVRDEQEMLPRCLEAVAPAVDEIVIVDTGSKDDTIEIARSFGARVIEREWTGSFAEARNISFDAATGDWLLYLDADEVLVAQDAEELRSLTGRVWREALYLSETNFTGEADAGTAVTHSALRVFRNRPQYRFDGRLHEQIASTLPGYLPERLELTSVRVEHYGYLSSVHRDREKSKRNIELLRMQQADGQDSAFLRFNLGCEHAAADEPEACLQELSRAWEMLEASPDAASFQFAPSLAKRLTRALRACGQGRAAVEFSVFAERRFPGFTDLVLERADAHAEIGERDHAIALYERCIEMGDAVRGYTATVGAGTCLPRLRLAELHLAAGEHDRAVSLLERSLQEHPAFVGSVLPFATALLSGGVEPDAVISRVQALVGEPSPTVRFMVGTALYEGGAVQAAERELRAVLKRQPRSGRALVALGEALLHQRRYEEAAQVARRLPVEDPLAVIACRTELFATIMGGASESATGEGDVHVSISRARRAGTSAAELALFEAWAQLAGVGDAADGASATVAAQAGAQLDAEAVVAQAGAQLDAEAVTLLATILEALLRVRELKAFEVLLPLLEASPMSVRDRRQALAEMYLRRGFAASAAEEWMANCKEEPDVRSLVGLAQVAATQGMARQAHDFASAALQRDPGNEQAARLIAATGAEPAVAGAQETAIASIAS